MRVAIRIDNALNLLATMECDETGTGWRKDLPPGSASWTRGTDNKIAHLAFVCPCGCGAIIVTPVSPGYSNSHWHWNGNEERPTLLPSILRTVGCRWHGYLTDGWFQSC